MTQRSEKAKSQWRLVLQRVHSLVDVAVGRIASGRPLEVAEHARRGDRRRQEQELHLNRLRVKTTRRPRRLRIYLRTV